MRSLLLISGSACRLVSRVLLIVRSYLCLSIYINGSSIALLLSSCGLIVASVNGAGLHSLVLLGVTECLLWLQI